MSHNNGVREVVGELFFLDLKGGRILRCHSDGTGLRVLVEGLTEHPDGIVVDTEAGHVYWTNMGSFPTTGNGSIQRCNLDGSDVTTIIPRGETYAPKQLKLESASGKLYWSDRPVRAKRGFLFPIDLSDSFSCTSTEDDSAPYAKAILDSLKQSEGSVKRLRGPESPLALYYVLISSRTELHQRRFYVTSVLLVSQVLRLGENPAQNGMDEIRVNVFFVQQSADRELDARNYVRLRFIRLPRNGSFFFKLLVAPHAAVYRNVQNQSNGVDH